LWELFSIVLGVIVFGEHLMGAAAMPLTALSAEALAKQHDREASLLGVATNALHLLQTLAEAEPPQPEMAETVAKEMVGLLNLVDFPAAQRAPIRDRLRELQCTAYRRRAEKILEQAVVHARHGDETARNQALAEARLQISRALSFGADERFIEAVGRLVEVVALTTGQGIDARAKAAAQHRLEESAPPPRWAGPERRRSIRFVDPPLEVRIDGLCYATRNWSPKGLCLEGYHEALTLRQRVRLSLTCAELPGRSGRCWARVVRREPDGALALECEEINLFVLELMHELKQRGEPATPEQ